MSATTLPPTALPSWPLDDEAISAICADQDAALARNAPIAGVAVVTGAGVSVSVRNGHLVVQDGLGSSRRERRFPRVAPQQEKLSRLVIEAGSGMLTLDALTWCRAVGVVVIGLDHFTGQPTFATLPEGPRDARLTRALALAGSQDGNGRDNPVGVGLRIVRRLLQAKLAGHWDIAGRLLGDETASDTIGVVGAGLEQCDTIDEMRQLEASAAAVYFNVWEKHPATVPMFVKRDAGRVPAAWAVYPGRRSEIGAGAANRRATHPTNAMLNYCFTLARVESGIALSRLGVDPALGVLHADMPRRDSLACDLSEVARPAVERYVLELLAARSFRRADFLEGREGEVRLGMSLRSELAGTMGMWSKEVGPYAEAIRNTLAKSVRSDASASAGLGETAPLTGARRKAAARAVVARKGAGADGAGAVDRDAGVPASSDDDEIAVSATRAAGDDVAVTAVPTNGAAAAVIAVGHKAALKAVRPKVRPRRTTLFRCLTCGGEVHNPRHVRCEACISADPRQAPALRATRAAAISSARQAEAGWSRHHPSGPLDPTWWREVCRPALAGLTIRDIVTATGCAKSSVSDWRSGRYVPHPMHWEALAKLAGIEPPGTTQPGRNVESQEAAG